MKKKVVIFDSSVWLSYVLKNDMNHKNTSSIFDDCIPKYKIIMPQIVFYEVTTVLLKLNEISALSEFLDFDFEIISLDNDLFLKYAFFIQKYIRSKTQDLLIIIFCLAYNVNDFKTFDKQQQRNYNIIRLSR